MSSKKASSAIAVIGMACRFPGSNDLKTFWENILSRKRQFRTFPKQRLSLSDYYDPDPETPDKTYCDKAAFIDGFEFDLLAHRVPKTSFMSADITHWLALDVALRSLADAGYSSKTVPNERSGVILGNTLTGEQSRAEGLRLRWPYVSRSLRAAARTRGLSTQKTSELLETMESYYKSVFAPVTEDTLSGALSNTIAGRICNYLDLHGGGYTVDGACSSSLVAVATAASALANLDMDLAFAGGVDISLDTFELIGFAKTAALTKTDMRVYDRRANGFMPGEGCGFVVLKRLEDAIADANYIYAVLHGWGISSDGRGGLTAPSAKGQATALSRAYERANFNAHDLDFIEGHGTGTALGDRVELEAISLAMGEGKDIGSRSCGITSLKSIIGHTKAASGIGGFIKTVIAVNRRVLPPTANCTEPSNVFEKSARLLYPLMSGEVRPPTDKLRAGVSAMGFGGINCHVTLESGDLPSARLAPAVEERKLLVSHQKSELFVLSASTLDDLVRRTRDLRQRAEGICEGEMADLAFQLSQEIDVNAPLRTAIVSGAPEEFHESLLYLEKLLVENPPSQGGKVTSPEQDIFVGNEIQNSRVGFLFPGQGSQKLNMTGTIIERHEWARDLTAKADTWLGKINGMDLSQHIFRSLDRATDQNQIDEWSESLRQTDIAQPAICLSSLLWIHELERLGIRPAAAGGHSLGELTAFYAAGAFDEKALMKLSAMRGEVMSAPGNESGIMVSLACSLKTASEILNLVKGYAVIANINGPKQVVISGERLAVERALAIAEEQGIVSQLLPVSNAFHSRFVSCAAEQLRSSAPVPDILDTLQSKLFSCTEGNEIRPGLNLREHFAGHAVSRVDFVSLVNAMALECDMLLEVGPGKVLTNLANKILGNAGPLCLPVESRPGRDNDLNIFLGNFFIHGGKINWRALYENRLVRPFIPSSERIYIENPCERPFEIPDQGLTETISEERGLIEVLLANEAGISHQTLSDYISGRGPFIGAVIKADLQNMRTYFQHADLEKVDLKIQSLSEKPVIKEKAESIPDKPDTESIPSMLVDLVEKKTGFPAQSLSMELKLLDDLNLDSIKASELIAEAAMSLGVAGDLNASRYANASLMEVADILARLKGEQRETHSSLTKAETETAPPVWVRNFAVRPVEENLPDTASHPDNTDWKKENILIVSEPDEQDVVQVMRERFIRQGARVQTELFEYVLNNGVPGKFEYTIFITVLPKYPRKDSLFRDRLVRIIERLRALISPPRRTVDDGNRTSAVYVQFGGGYFGTGRNVSIEQCSAAALAATLHLERPDLKVRVIDFDPGVVPVHMAEKVIAELMTPESYATAGYDQTLTRRVPRPVLQQPADYLPRPIEWSSIDVVLVTGGGRGITAECALEFAKATNVRMALAGSSAHPDLNSAAGKGGEIAETLKRFSESGLAASYYQCDITDADAVQKLIYKVRREIGTITGVIHGSALNIPGDLDKVSTEDAFREVSPKVFGAANLCRALADAPPKLFAGFSSIIGVSGMMRNGWYGFSNEAMNLILGRFGEDHPESSVITMAFSLWDDIGMGVRMGSKAYLAGMGIGAIPAREGVRRFMQLVTNDPGEKQVVVAARIAGLDTFRPRPFSLPSNARFLEKVTYYYPGVEVVTRSRLSLERDTYLKDHVWRGTYLFPTVFGLEAMAQAAAYVTGESNFDSLCIEDIRLERPITVHPEDGEEIEVRAEVFERDTRHPGMKVRVGISCGQSGFKTDHFSATFVFNDGIKARRYSIDLPEEPLGVEPGKDLYNGQLLFHGPLFQTISSVYFLDSDMCVFRSAINSSGNVWLTGDPFFRDSLLHSAQLPVSRDTCLPLRIESIERYKVEGDLPQSLIGIATIEDRNESDIFATVHAVTESGQVVEIIKGYVSKIMEHHEDYPGPEEIAGHVQNDEADILKALSACAGHYGLKAPEVSVVNLPGIHSLTKDERHKLELPILRDTVRRAMKHEGDSSNDFQISWQTSGRPQVECKNDHGIDISLSHEKGLLLCTAGTGLQGCDMAAVTERPRHLWNTLLGRAQEALLQELLAVGEPLDRSGARVWAAFEALCKARGPQDFRLAIDKRDGDRVLFRVSGEHMNLRVLTFPVMLSGGLERIIAFVAYSESESSSHRDKLNFNFESYKAKILDGPQGRPLFIFQFPVTFREASNPSRTLYFSHYFAWIGKLREFMVQPVYEKLVEWFSTGKWGMVTNHAETRIYGEAGSGDIIEGSLWLDNVSGRDNSRLEFCFEWRKILKNGERALIATSGMSATWGSIPGHGIVEVQPLPDFGKEFVKNMLPPPDMKNAVSAPVVPLPLPDLGKLLYKKPPGPLEPSSLLKEEIYQSSLEDANLVGNIYFSNYYIWQGRTRDRFLYETAPEYLNGSGVKGEFRCVSCSINHMNEAMPFDQIAVRMHLAVIYTRAVRFCFDYYRLAPDGARHKLGSGEHEALWYAPDDQGRWSPSEMPEKLLEALIPEDRKNQGPSRALQQTGTSSRYDVIVIGAGIGGLTAASLLAKQGNRVLVIEHQNRPGGFCTSWDRNIKGRDKELRYVFDSGVHDISGLGQKGLVRKILEELDISDRIEWKRMDHEYILPDLQIKVPRGIDNYIASLTARFPAEQEGLRGFFHEMQCCYHEMYDGSSDKNHSTRWKNISFSKMLDAYFRDPRLKKLLSILYVYISDAPEKISALNMVPLFGYYIDGGYYPAGGSQVFSDTLAGAVTQNRGEMLFNTSAARIMIDKGHVTGVRLEKGEVIYSETVVSNADLRRTFLELAGLQYLPSYLSARIMAVQPSCSAFMVSLGVDFIPDIQPATFMSGGNKDIEITIPSKVDPSLAPQGHACITLLTLLPHEQAYSWQRRAPGYDELKRQFGDELIALADKAIPGLKKHIVFRQDASPATFSRYALTSGGGIYGLPIDEWRPPAKTPVEGLYLAGAGVAARPGVESAVYSGIVAADAVTLKTAVG